MQTPEIGHVKPDLRGKAGNAVFREIKIYCLVLFSEQINSFLNGFGHDKKLS
jgi:hypothetical protein